jgi:hypothetical protein
MSKKVSMSQGNKIKFAAYLGDNNPGSDQFRAHYAQLPQAVQETIKIMKFQDVVAALGSRKPAWLRGIPTVASFKDPPDVWEGTKAIQWIAGVAQQYRMTQPQQAPAVPQMLPSFPQTAQPFMPPAQHQQFQQPQQQQQQYQQAPQQYQQVPPQQTSSSARGLPQMSGGSFGGSPASPFDNVNTVVQTSDGAFGNNASVVTDDLYSSHMANKNGGGMGGGGGRGGGGKITNEDIAAYNSSRR